MNTVEGLMDSLNCTRPNYSTELFEIGKLNTPEQKSLALRGRFDLAVNSLVVWDMLQIELRSMPGLESVKFLMLDELKEVVEKEPLERELIKLKDKHLQWYKRPRAKDYWSVANEMADVLVFLVGDMRLNGLSDEEVMESLVGRAPHNDKALINEMIARTSALGMDLAEVIVYKTEINMQHRDPTLLPRVRGDGFMKKMRRSIGDDSSQIPHLGQGPLGVTVLTELQSPKLISKTLVDMLNLEQIFVYELANPQAFFAVN